MAEQPRLMDFFEWIRTVEIVEDEYCFEYDENGTVLCSKHFQKDLPPNCIKVDDELALNIFEGKDHLRFYKVDVLTKELKKIDPLGNTIDVNRIDNVLHRVIERKWSDVTDPHIIITHNKKENTLLFNLSPNISHREWSGDTEMIFLITEYNDPNILKNMIHLNIGDITGQTKVFENISLPENFSIYTRRIFEHYVFEEI